MAEESMNNHPVDEGRGEEQPAASTSKLPSALKLITSAALLFSAVSTYSATFNVTPDNVVDHAGRRRLASVEDKDYVPKYMLPLMKDLKERKKLMEETPKEEIKYWFEYAGPLQKYFYRYSKSRGKADYFEGRDDSGVTSARFVEELGGGKEFKSFYSRSSDDIPAKEMSAYTRMLDNCLAMGSPARPDLGKGSFWYEWFGGKGEDKALDRCRVLIAINTVGAGRGTTMLWETAPPVPHAAGPKPWQSEQETAAMHLERNLKEIDAMCATGLIAARVQVLVCEPIPGEWTDWMDSQLVNCGGKPAPLEKKKSDKVNPKVEVEERASPVQVVVVASSDSADQCHNLQSGFMEKRLQDLVLAPPLFVDAQDRKLSSSGKYDSSIKTTHPDLVSSDNHDVYVAMKWSSLVTVRTVSAFLQASADLAAAAASPNKGKTQDEDDPVSIISSRSGGPMSPFLIPSFVRVSYVSEENNKVAKWRMHGDFFHPAAWEICKDSYDMTWIPDSLSGSGGVNSYCSADYAGEDCGQWWAFMAEEQMPTTPEVYANEVTKPLVQGGSNFFWMVTERQRREIVDKKICEHETPEAESKKKCVPNPQAVMPLGDLESFLVNYMPNTALGKKHEENRRPGYSVAKQREEDRAKVRERKQLKGQEDIEKALFDYTVYPAALFHKDATIQAARAMDAVLSKGKENSEGGITTVKSSYYDVTIIKPRQPVSGWCQAMARMGLCSLYADYLRQSNDKRCWEACGLLKNWAPIDFVAE
mmetsp:Transcript_53133/g.78852  ORF Transcript_53133/g.78852 Transcript_53133/m.78852 type:complete len:758 (-) Transcript_53133:84-2357(-)|eukprot:CAMPEP_0195523980 /NCGR_PEP_ID=MMETSP0794_2-20130614/23519_1 /TAXON_ID=515487 /ORGANISM="Stephanopyxis turris, Strain CCMP 815" /LENGTH=757 /DNA_ID=CAMNT_0040654101 /DNA_START=48 /DNA_END=2321 /DNA_ORIENTATION=+